MSDKAIRAAKLTAAGLLDKARARTAVTRAGGQIAPSKYLPGVPRQVHADGGSVYPPFMDHLQKSADDMGHGFHWEEGGCLGMAHALAEEIGGNIAASKSGFKHYYAEKNGNLYDYTGKTQDKAGHRIVSLVDAMRNIGSSPEEHSADKSAAHEVIEEAKTRVPRQVHADGGRENGNDGIAAAEAVAKMLREGRAKEVTNDHLDAADPQHLSKLYETGQTGMDFPMDHASRMERAKTMGFDTGNKLYHGTDRAFSAFDPKKFGEKDAGWYGRGVTTDTDPEVAEGYANYHEPEQGQNIIPTFSRGRHIDWPSANQPFGNPRESAQGTKDMQALGYSGSRMTNDRDLYGSTPDVGSEQVTFDPNNVRSRFARFDPRLAHLSHLNAATGGRIGYMGGGNVDDPQPAAPPPADLGQAREQKQLRTFHTGLMGDIKSSVSAMQMAHQKALDAGVFDGYEVGDVFQGSAHPMRITGRYVQKWKPTPSMLQSFDRMKAKPTIIEHEGQQYIPMLRYQTGKEDVDGFQEGSAYLDGVKAAGYRKMGGLRSVKADGGRIHANKGGKMGARADFIAGNHPEVPSVVYHSTKADFHEFRPLSHFGTAKAAHDRHHAGTWNTGRVIDATDKVSVMPAHISLKNPLDVGTERDWADNPQMIRQAADTMFKSGMIDPDYLKAAEKLYDLSYDRDLVSDPREFDRQAAQALREAGHDGIIYTNRIEDPGSRSFVTLGPEQVKSSIGNQGTFDPTNPNMTKKDGGEVDGDDGIDAYHGSPHDFDEFNIAHLGTGEGAQAYGHGLYFAGNEKIAKHYKNVLSTRNRVQPDDEAMRQFSPQFAEIQRRKAALSGNDGLVSLDTGSDELDAIGADEEKLHRMMIADTVKRKPHLQYGRMYKVKLNVQPHELLDWDAPLSEQHPNIQRIAREADISKAVGPTRGVLQAWREGRDVGVEATGKDLHKALSGYGEHNKDAADYLQSQGLKGIKYRDAGSRDLSDGDPTHNYVMFHHDPVKVVDKYEYGGVVGKSGGGSMGDDDQPVDLGVARAMRRFNQTDNNPPPEVEGIFNRLATAKDAAADAHETAQKAGAFDNVQIGDVLKYKLHSGYAPMKVIGHGMVPVNRWGGINPPKYVYKDHFPVAHVEYQDASKERASPAIELLEDRDRYDFLSGRPRAVRKRGGLVDAALAATRRFTKDGKAATMALKPKGK